MKRLILLYIILLTLSSVTLAGSNLHEDYFHKNSFSEKIKYGLISKTIADENDYSYILQVPTHVYIPKFNNQKNLDSEKYKSCMLNYYENNYYFQGETETIFSRKDNSDTVLYIIKINRAFKVNVPFGKSKFTINGKSYYLEYSENSIKINNFSDNDLLYMNLVVSSNIQLGYVQRLAIQNHYDAGFDKIVNEILTATDIEIYRHNSEICKALFTDKNDLSLKKMLSNLSTVAKMKFDLGRFL